MKNERIEVRVELSDDQLDNVAGGRSRIRIEDISDGTSNTVLNQESRGIMTLGYVGTDGASTSRRFWWSR